jgi:hypothetical protein
MTNELGHPYGGVPSSTNLRKGVGMNEINVISPYKFKGQWVFDDPEKELVKEPFVAGADTIIDKLVRDIPDAKKGFTLIFSEHMFPGSQTALAWMGAELKGNWYKDRSTGMLGWLCPALMKYFDEVPQVIYVQVKAVTNA